MSRLMKVFLIKVYNFWHKFIDTFFRQLDCFILIIIQSTVLGVNGLMDRVLFHAERDLNKIPEKCFQKCLEEKLVKEKLLKL